MTIELVVYEAQYNWATPDEYTYVIIKFQNGQKYKLNAVGKLEQFTPPPKEMVEGTWKTIAEAKRK